MALQLGVQGRQLELLGQKSQDGIVDELLFVLREEALRRTERDRGGKLVGIVLWSMDINNLD